MLPGTGGVISSHPSLLSAHWHPSPAVRMSSSTRVAGIGHYYRPAGWLVGWPVIENWAMVVLGRLKRNYKVQNLPYKRSTVYFLFFYFWLIIALKRLSGHILVSSSGIMVSGLSFAL